MRGETLLVAKARADRGTIHNVPVLMLVAAVVILAGVVVVASGRGGEIAPEYPDYPPIDLGPVTAADVALLRPPSAAWGYNMRVTDEALETIARAVTERDIKIAELQQQLDDLRGEPPQQRERPSGAWPAVADAGNEEAEEAEEVRGAELRSGQIGMALCGPECPVGRSGDDTPGSVHRPPRCRLRRGDRPAARRPGPPPTGRASMRPGGLPRRRSGAGPAGTICPITPASRPIQTCPSSPRSGPPRASSTRPARSRPATAKAGRRRLAPARRGLPAARPKPAGPGPLGPKSPRPGMGRMMPGQSPSSGMTRIRRWSGARSTSAPRPAACRSRTRPPSPASMNPRPASTRHSRARTQRRRARTQRGRASARPGPARPQRRRARPQRDRARHSGTGPGHSGTGPGHSGTGPGHSGTGPGRGGTGQATAGPGQATAGPGQATAGPGQATAARAGGHSAGQHAGPGQHEPGTGQATAEPGQATAEPGQDAADSDDERSLAHSEQDRD